MSKDILLMSEDIPVLRCNLSNHVFDVLCESLLPFRLRGALTGQVLSDEYGFITKSDRTAFVSWLASRTLSLSRRNAKKLFNLLRVPQEQSSENRARLALMCKAVSANDNYWVKIEDSALRWDDINIRKVPLNEIVSQVALHGSPLSLQGSLSTPEYSTQGAYAKAWKRHSDGNLWLYKLSNTSSSIEANIEVMVSNLLDKTNVSHCHYEAGFDSGRYVCMCPNLASDSLSIVSGEDLMIYCNHNYISADRLVKRLSEKDLYKMWIVDYIISNIDRHSLNWGLYFSPGSGNLIGLHPLIDHNNAFDEAAMKQPDFEYVFNGESSKECALYAVKRTDFKFTARVTKRDFLTMEMWESFQSRCNMLGLSYS